MCCCCTLQHKTEAELTSALKALLSMHGLSASSDQAALARVKAKLELKRELEGIETTNIISDSDGGRPTRRAAARVNFK